MRRRRYETEETRGPTDHYCFLAFERRLCRRNRILGGRFGRGQLPPPPSLYPIFQVSPETSSLAMSPDPRSEIAFCSCWINISSYVVSPDSAAMTPNGIG